MNLDALPSELDPDTIFKLVLKVLLHKSLGKYQNKNAPELEQMPAQDYKLLDEKRQVYEHLTRDYPLNTGKEMSKNERYDKNWLTAAFTYGEIDFKAFAEILYLIKKKYRSLLPSGCVFYDLGSGLGKGVIAAAVVHDFSVCVGIEMLESLYEVSLKMKTTYEQYMASQGITITAKQNEQDDKPTDEEKTSAIEDTIQNKDISYRPEQIDWEGKKFTVTPQVTFERGDILKRSWTDGTLIFANSTCFDHFLMWRIAKRAKLLPKNALFVTLTKRLPDYINWDLLECYQCVMSWGDATVFIHCKRHDPTEEDIKASINTAEEEEKEEFRKFQESQRGEEEEEGSDTDDDNLFADLKLLK